MKIYHVYGLIVMLVLVQGGIRDEVDSNVENISNFLLELIQKYDKSGKGAIAIEEYPHFLRQVLITGHQSTTPGAQIDQPTKDLLLDATTGFTKKYNTTQVGIQDFYFDLVKQFTTYLLQDEEKYNSIIQTFFGDTPSWGQKSDGFGQEAESDIDGVEEKQEL